MASIAHGLLVNGSDYDATFSIADIVRYGTHKDMPGGSTARVDRLVRAHLHNRSSGNRGSFGGLSKEREGQCHNVN